MEKHYFIIPFAELSGILKSTSRRYDTENKLKSTYTSSGGHRGCWICSCIFEKSC